MCWFDGPFGDLWFWFMVLHGLLTGLWLWWCLLVVYLWFGFVF